MTPDEDIGRRGREIYDRDLRAKLEPAHKGDFVAINVQTGEYAVGKRALDAVNQLRQRGINPVFFIGRVGYQAAYRLGWHSRKRNSSP